jgi:hypothetical protein
MEKEKINLQFSAKLLEVGKDDDELKNIGEKHLLQLPAKDLSIFKCVYAFVDKQNKNGCTLPRDEAEKALGSLTGKSVDFDHFRKKIVGYWLEGSLVGDEIHAYGVFFKGSLPDEYEELLDMLERNELTVSFEAWGNKEGTPESYNLTDIEFAGGGLLILTEPAFDGAMVLEMANKNKDVIQELHKGTFSIYDFDTILRLIAEAPKPAGEEDGFFDIEAIDFTNAEVRARYWPGDNVYSIKLKPKVKKVESGSIEKIEKIDKSSDQDDHNRDSQTHDVEEAQKMEEKIKELEQEIASLKEKLEASDSEKAELATQLEAEKANVEQAKADLEQAKTDQEKAVEVAKEEATKVAERRAELGEEFAKDMSDEDVLSDDKYEIAKLKKENSELKKASKKADKTPEAASTETATDLEVGTKDKKQSEEIKKSSHIHSLAFGE